MKNEKWKDIQDYEELYQVSDYGRIKNKKGEILSPYYDKNGYLRIDLYKGKRKTFLVHRLVALIFLEKIPSKDIVDHIDTKRDNNNVNNLRWVNYIENANNPKTRINVLKAREKQRGKTINNIPVRCIETNKIYKSTLEVEREIGIYHNQISKCCLKRKNYNTAGGYHWEYA